MTLIDKDPATFTAVVGTLLPAVNGDRRGANPTLSIAAVAHRGATPLIERLV